MVEQFTQFGTTTLQVQPGKTSTFGISPGVLNSVRPLSLEDAEALARAPHVLHVRAARRRQRLRRGPRPRAQRRASTRLGLTSTKRSSSTSSTGTFLPPDELERARNVAVLGAKLYRGALRRRERARRPDPRRRPALPRRRHHGIRRATWSASTSTTRCTSRPRAASSCSIAKACSRSTCSTRRTRPSTRSSRASRRILAARHGAEDFTVITQQQMLDVLGSIVDVLTLGVAALGGISLLVGGVGIFTIMTIAVRERTQEIGLLRAIGARRARIAQLFVGEAMLLSAIGGAGGLALGFAIVLARAVGVARDARDDLAAVRGAVARARRVIGARGRRAAGAQRGAARAARRAARRVTQASNCRMTAINGASAAQQPVQSCRPSLCRRLHETPIASAPARHERYSADNFLQRWSGRQTGVDARSCASSRPPRRLRLASGQRSTIAAANCRARAARR